MSSMMSGSNTLNNIMYGLKVVLDDNYYYQDIAKRQGYDIIKNPEKLFLDLAKLNAQVISDKYAVEVDISKYQYNPAHCCSLVQAYKSMNFYTYQVAEGYEYESTNVYQLLERFSYFLADFIIRNSKEYDLAEWG